MTLMTKPLDQQVFGGPRSRDYPAPVELLHVSIIHYGPGFDELIRFYQVVLNMRFVWKLGNDMLEFIALSADDENHRLGFVNHILPEGEPGLDPGERGFNKPIEGVEPRNEPLRKCRIEHTNWRYLDFEAVLLTAKRVHEELGIWPRTARHDGLDLTIDYIDPDGNRVELLSQTLSKPEILLQKLQESEGTRTPENFYMAFNMEKMIRLYEAGTPIGTLMDRQYCKQLIDEGKL